jgi:hypothetical protein
MHDQKVKAVQQTFEPSYDRMVQSIGLSRKLASPFNPLPVFNKANDFLRVMTNDDVVFSKTQKINRNLDPVEKTHLKLKDLYFKSNEFEQNFNKLS